MAKWLVLERRFLAHRDASLRRTDWVAIGGIADMPGASRTSGCDATDPKQTSLTLICVEPLTLLIWQAVLLAA